MEGADRIAAFVGEPLLGTGGIIPPTHGFWGSFQEILNCHEILLISDEVVTGFGQLGTMFDSTFYDIRYENITIAKCLAYAYAHLSGSINSDRVFDVIALSTDTHGVFRQCWTNSAHPIGAAADIANLELIDQLGLVEKCRRYGRERFPYGAFFPIGNFCPV